MTHIEEAREILQKWLDEMPDYQGDDPRANHYRRNREALKTALASLQSRDAEIEALKAKMAERDATIERIRRAISFVEPRAGRELDRAVAADLANGMSLRKAAEKHGVSFGIIRGVRARIATALGEKA
jgi:hypothetical protein